jgi:hypothetical protein
MATSFDECRTLLISTVHRIVIESGEPKNFDPVSWTDEWLTHPVPALGGVTPKDYILSGHDCQDLIDILLRMQSGAYG